MLKVHVIKKSTMWSRKLEVCLSFVEFVYNNIYQSSIEMTPYKTLHDRLLVYHHCVR